MSSSGAGSVRALALKKSPEDILNLFNTAPGNQLLFAGSPAQDQFFQPSGLPLVSASSSVRGDRRANQASGIIDRRANQIDR